MSGPFIVTDVTSGRALRCPAGVSLLGAVERAADPCVPVGCRGGGCGVCRVHIDDGTYTVRAMSRRHVSVDDQALGYALACRTYPTSDLSFVAAPPLVPAGVGGGSALPDNTNPTKTVTNR